MKIYRTSLARNYVSDWGVKEAIRELFQNAIDHGEWSWSYRESRLCIESREADLEPKTLLLGYSDKPEGSIGKFGEGYKLAALVLVREGLGMRILRPDGRGSWTPRLSKSKTFETEQLVFDIRESDYDGSLRFEVTGLTDEHLEELRSVNLHVREPVVLFESGGSRVLVDQPGRVFVRGLWVTDVKDFVYGYDFDPKVIPLDRDRRMVATFDVSWAASQLWMNSERPEFLDLMHDGAPDVAHVQYKISRGSQVADRVVAFFVEKYGSDAVAVSSQSELRTAIDEGRTNVVMVNTNMTETLKYSRLYAPPPPPKPKLTPCDLMQEFYEKHEATLAWAGLKDGFLELLEASKNWRELG